MAAPGGGKFDKECEALLIQEGAAWVIVLVAGGKRGGGFSLSCQMPNVPNVPAILRRLAAEIEQASTQEGGG